MGMHKDTLKPFVVREGACREAWKAKWGSLFCIREDCSFLGDVCGLISCPPVVTSVETRLRQSAF